MADVGLEIKIKADTGQARMSLEQFRAAMGANMEAVVKQSVIGSSAVSKAVAETAAATQKSSAAIADSLVKGIEKSAVATNKLKSETDLLIEKSQAAVRAAQSTAQAAENAIGKTSAKIAGATTEAENFGSKFSAIAGPLGIATGVVVGLGAAAVGVSVAMFESAKKAADFGSQIYDLQQKTLLSAATLSTLKVAAEQSGTTIERVGTLTAKWAGTLADARDEHSKAAKVLGQFGIDATKAYQDPDAALKQFIDRFNTLPPSAAKNRAEMLLFKDRTGELLPVLDQIGGSFEKFQAKAKELGLVLSDDDTRAADAFGDKLTELGQVSSALSRQFGQQLLPTMTEFFDEIERLLVNNQDTFKRWGEYASNVIRGVGVVIETLRLNQSGVPITTAYSTAQAEQQAINAQQALAAVSRGGGAVGKTGPDIATTFGKDKKEKDTSGKDFRDEFKQALEDYQAYSDKIHADIDADKAKYEDGSKSFGEFANNTIDNINKLILARQNSAIVEKASADLHIKNLTERSNAEKDIAHKLADDLKKLDAEKKAATKARDDEDVAAFKRIVEQREAYYAREKELVQRSVKEGALTEDQGRLKILDIQRQELEDQQQYLAKAYENVSTDRAKREEIFNELFIKHKQYLDLLKDEYDMLLKVHNEELVGTINKDIGKEVTPPLPNQGPPPGSIIELINKGLGTGAGGVLQGLDTGVFDVVRDKTTGASRGIGTMTDAIHTLGQVGGTVLKGLAQGVGQMVSQWVLMGSVGPNAFRKVTASILATLAEQAAVQALMELAYGFAALTPWGAALYGPAPFHFKAAALLGAVALTAGVTGRAIAGDAFQQSGGSGGGSATGSAGGFGGSNPSAQQQTQTLIQSRNQSEPQTIILHIHSHTDGGAIIDKVVADVGNNGRMRDVIIKTANS